MLIGVISMAGAETVQNIAVILGALIDVFNQQTNRRAGGVTLNTPDKMRTASGSRRWVAALAS